MELVVIGLATMIAAVVLLPWIGPRTTPPWGRVPNPHHRSNIAAARPPNRTESDPVQLQHVREAKTYQHS